MQRGDKVKLYRLLYSAWFAKTYPSLVNYLDAMPLSREWTVRQVYAKDVTLVSGTVTLLRVPRCYVVGSKHISD
jgi:hypothetical protein